MGVWTELVGVRRDLRLRAKWWHHVVVGLAWFSSVIVYLIVVGAITKRPPKLTTSNTYSLTMLNNTMARKATTTLADLDGISGIVGQVEADGNLTPLPRKPGDDVRCEYEARYKAAETIKVGQQDYKAIPDYPNQPDPEMRHCVATPAYASLTAKSIALYVPDGTGQRKTEVRAFVAGISVVMVWLVFYWNFYYRGLMPFYARYRQARKRRNLERHTVRQP